MFGDSIIIGNGHWLFPRLLHATGKEVGFLYVIEYEEIGVAYLGKKTYTSKTNWKTYKSSSKRIKELDQFTAKYHVLGEFNTKSGLNYAETKALCMIDAPLKDYWLNVRIEEVSWHVKERMSEECLNRLNYWVSWHGNI